MEKELQRKYIEFQLLNQHIKKIDQQLAELGQQLTGLLILKDGLGDLKKTTSKDLFVSLGPGVFLEATLKDTERVLVNVGSNILVKKLAENTKEMISGQIDEMRELIQKIEQEMETEKTQLEALQKELKDSI